MGYIYSDSDTTDRTDWQEVESRLHGEIGVETEARLYASSTTGAAYRENAAKALKAGGVDMYNRVIDESKLSAEVLEVLNSRDYDTDRESLIDDVAGLSDYRQALSSDNNENSDSFSDYVAAGMYDTQDIAHWRAPTARDESGRVIRGNHWKGTVARFSGEGFYASAKRRQNALDREVFPYLFGRNGKRLAASTVVKAAHTAANKRSEDLEAVKAENEAKREAKRQAGLAKLQAKFAKVS